MAQLPPKFNVYVFKNITSERFEHSYEGLPFIIEAGEELTLPDYVAKALAKHLAMKILRMRAKGDNSLEVRMRLGTQFSESDLAGTMGQILGSVVKEVSRPGNTLAEQIKRDVDELNADRNTAPAPAPQHVPTGGDMTKKEIMQELDKRGIKYQAAMTKNDLMQLLEAYGGGPRKAGNPDDGEGPAEVADTSEATHQIPA